MTVNGTWRLWIILKYLSVKIGHQQLTHSSRQAMWLTTYFWAPPNRDKLNRKPAWKLLVVSVIKGIKSHWTGSREEEIQKYRQALCQSPVQRGNHMIRRKNLRSTLDPMDFVKLSPKEDQNGKQRCAPSHLSLSLCSIRKSGKVANSFVYRRAQVCQEYILLCLFSLSL